MGDGLYKNYTISSRQVKIYNSYIKIIFKYVPGHIQLYCRTCEKSLRIAQKS